jgi:PadR family transcriptional regulator
VTFSIQVLGFPQKIFKFALDNNTVCHIVCITHCMKNSTQLDVSLFENLKLELRRGCLIVAVLAQLRQEHYGYTLRKALADQGLAIDEGTLYPLLRRLETQGLLASEWREESKRNKRFYRLSEPGGLILRQLLDEWQTINASLDRILQEA